MKKNLGVLWFIKYFNKFRLFGMQKPVVDKYLFNDLSIVD